MFLCPQHTARRLEYEYEHNDNGNDNDNGNGNEYTGAYDSAYTHYYKD